MDVFALRNHVIAEYTAYTRSFMRILNLDPDAFVQRKLQQGRLWPDALIHLSPAFFPANTVQYLAHYGVLHLHTAEVFHVAGSDGTRFPLRLYQHQRQAISLVANRQHFVFTTGTGSGKNLTYLIPIVDQCRST